jgi:hypothetical protein
MKIFIACSKYFYDRVNEIREVLEAAGHEITLPSCFDNPFEEEDVKRLSRKEHVVWKCNMMKRHEGNIVGQDAVLVLNFEKNGISNYIGGATFMEVVKAWEMDKRIFFYNPLPKCSFSDELIGINPVVINGNLEMVR